MSSNRRKKREAADFILLIRSQMMIDLTVKLLLFLFPLAYSPGPGNMFFAANGARFGFRGTIASNAGYHLATWIVTLAIGLGFGWIAVEFPSFLTIIQYLGCAYVLHLAWSLFRTGAKPAEMDARSANFFDGVVLLILNPKAYLIIALMFSQFTNAASDVEIFLVVWIATVFTLNNLIAFCTWAYIGDRLASAFRKPEHANRLNMFFGGVLACVAIWMLFT